MAAHPLRPLSQLDEPFTATTADKKSGKHRKAARFEAPPPELCDLFPVAPEPVVHIDSTGARFRMELDWNDRAKV